MILGLLPGIGGCCLMAEKPNDKELVSFKELQMGQMIQVDYQKRQS